MWIVFLEGPGVLAEKYTQPVWIAIGIIALVLIIVLITMAGRGRDTTVVK